MHTTLSENKQPDEFRLPFGAGRKITMLGRIMAGSQAVIAHNEEGPALWVE